MAGFNIFISIPSAILPESARTVLLTNISSTLASQLAAYYSSITVESDDSYVFDSDGAVSHEILGTVSSPYYGAYGDDPIFS